jgi:hypothetical protein
LAPASPPHDVPDPLEPLEPLDAPLELVAPLEPFAGTPVEEVPEQATKRRPDKKKASLRMVSRAKHSFSCPSRWAR